MSETFETALLKADVYPVKGREVYWLIVKGQLEHVVTDLSICRIPFANKYIHGIAAWQGLVIPVVSLEKFFNFKTIKDPSIQKRVLVKTAFQNTEKTAARMFIDIPYDIRMRSIGADCSPAKISAEDMRARGLVGVYEWEEDKLLLVPDLTRIATGGLAAVS